MNYSYKGKISKINVKYLFDEEKNIQVIEGLEGYFTYL